MSPSAIVGVIFVAVLVAGLLATVAVMEHGSGRARRRRIGRVLARIDRGPAGDTVDDVADADGPRGTRASLVRGDGIGAGGLERILGRILPRREALRLRLDRAGLDLSIGRYVLISVVTAVVAMVVTWVVLGQSLPMAALAGITIGIAGPHKFVGLRIGRRMARFLQTFPEAIDLMVRGLRSGLPITETMLTVGEECADPVGSEFRTMTDAIRLGTPMEDALWATARRLDLAEFKFFVISLSVQRETGGNLAETLANLSDILRKRLQMRLKVKAMSSEARASAYIIGALPFLMFAILALMNPEYVMVLLRDPRGIMMTAAGAGVMGIGIMVMFKMVRFEV